MSADKTDELIREFVAAGGRAEDWRPAWSIAPTNDAPIVRETVDDGRHVDLARWEWPRRDGRPGPPTINARMERLTGLWAGPFSAARVLVPMTGWYEWTGERGAKQGHYLHGAGTLAAAGLTWLDTNAPDGIRQRRFVVITREARDASGDVHDRMPAFVVPELWDEWLSGAHSELPAAAARQARAELVDELTASSEAIASTIRTHLVGRAINNSRTVDRYDASIAAPLGPSQN